MAYEVNSIVMVFGERKIAWQLSDNQMAVVAQTLAQILGPAEEVK